MCFFAMEQTKDGLMANDPGLDAETRKEYETGLDDETRMVKDNGLENGQRAGQRKSQVGGRKYLKEATVIINVEDVQEVRAEDIIKAVIEKCGHGKILALRPRQGKEYELTMETEELCEQLTDKLMINGVNCEIKKLHNRDFVVSFMHLPVYLEDKEILEKLDTWGVCPISKIKRRFYPGTDIEDGTRFLKVRFPKEVASLPYSTKMETAEGTQYFRVMHSHQVKTCRLCMSPEHMLKDCPEFKCYKCEERGHFARHCITVRCPECKNFLNKCECWMEGEEGGGEDQDRQVHEENNKREEDNEAIERTMEEEMNNNEKKEGENENEENEVQLSGQDGQWSQMEISDSFKTFLSTVEKEELRKTGQAEGMANDEETRMENVDKNKVERGFLRRRTFKVKPNLDMAKKKVLTKNRAKYVNRYEVLRGLEEDEEK